MIGMIGLDHNWAPAEVRGRLSFTGEHLDAALRALAAAPQIDEVALLSTCNRTEVYVSALEWPEARAAIVRFLEAAHRAGPEADVTAVPAADQLASNAPAERERPWAPKPQTSQRSHDFAGTLAAAGANLPVAVEECLYAEEGAEAARHLFRVAAGLRSMLVGESQILGQVKEALAAGEAAGSVGEELRALFTQAIKVGKRARTQTHIGQVDHSLAAAAIQVAAESLGELAGTTALVIGAGKTSQLCTRLLRDAGVARLVLANRSARAAEELADEVGAEVVLLEDVRDVVGQADLVVSATAAPHVVLSAATVASGLAGRHQSLVIVDLAVPADVEPAVGLLPQVSLYTLDMLRSATTALAAGAVREADVVAAESVVEAGAREWQRARHLRQAVPGIAALRRHVDHSQQAELERALSLLEQLGTLSDAEREVVTRFGQRLVDKMFHHLVARIRSLAEYDEVPPELTMRILARLFADPDGEGNDTD
jgi:glutamyl-tRNA reductase